MPKYEKPDYHAMDSRQLRAFGADLDNESIKKYYTCMRRRWTMSGQKGQMPIGSLHWIASYPDVMRMQTNGPIKEAVVATSYKHPPKEPELVGAVDGGEHANDDVY